MESVIMAGGFGSRRPPLTTCVPTSAVPICAVPIVEHAIRLSAFKSVWRCG